MFPSTLCRADNAVCGRHRGPDYGRAGDPAEIPPVRRCTTSITRSSPSSRTSVEIYYRDVDPPNWADYSHNPYVFSPNAEADVGPDQQWNLDVSLANPDEWAMVTADQRPSRRSHPTSTACWRSTASWSRRIRDRKARSARFAIGDRRPDVAVARSGSPSSRRIHRSQYSNVSAWPVVMPSARLHHQPLRHAGREHRPHHRRNVGGLDAVALQRGGDRLVLLLPERSA